MKLSEIAKNINMDFLTPIKDDRNIKYGYVSDMLSDVMGNAPSESALITILAHENVIAVALLRDIELIILVNGRKADQKTLDKAKEEDIVIGSTKLSAFEVAGILHSKGISGDYSDQS